MDNCGTADGTVVTDVQRTFKIDFGRFVPLSHRPDEVGQRGTAWDTRGTPMGQRGTAWDRMRIVDFGLLIEKKEKSRNYELDPIQLKGRIWVFVDLISLTALNYPH